MLAENSEKSGAAMEAPGEALREAPAPTKAPAPVKARSVVAPEAPPSSPPAAQRPAPRVRPKSLPRPRRESHTIGFRVDNYTLTQLEKGAAAYGISVHEYARQRLMELLERQDEARLLDEAAATRRGVDGLRDDLAATLEVILLNTTKGDPERIRGWIDEHLRRTE